MLSKDILTQVIILGIYHQVRYFEYVEIYNVFLKASKQTYWGILMWLVKHIWKNKACYMFGTGSTNYKHIRIKYGTEQIFVPYSFIEKLSIIFQYENYYFNLGTLNPYVCHCYVNIVKSLLFWWIGICQELLRESMQDMIRTALQLESNSWIAVGPS